MRVRTHTHTHTHTHTDPMRPLLTLTHIMQITLRLREVKSLD